jgi:DNA modification methylase
VIDVEERMISTNEFTIYNADCIEIAKELPDNSIDFTLYSPPFGALYVYSNIPNDLGNVRNDAEFYAQFAYLVKELYRITKPGRLMAVHCMDIPAMKEKDGYIGLKDFPGNLLRMFQQEGFIYHSRVTIWKDPLTEATRTKALGLMHKQLTKDSSMSRQGIPDYLIVVRKPGDNEERITHVDGLTTFYGEGEPTDGVFSHQVWRKYASPVWMDIRQSYTLQKESAREEKDEKHIAPLQLDVIARAVELWSNEGDIVLDPFTGIGSTGYQAIKMNRRFIGMELKGSYYKQAVANLQRAANSVKQPTLFDAEESS